jgi:pilus assembly protein Flp/PilA
MRTIIDHATVKILSLAHEKKGVTAIEYGLIAGFVALVIIGGITAFGEALNTFFTDLADKMPTSGGAAAPPAGG